MLINTSRRSALVWLFAPPIVLLLIFVTSHRESLVSSFQTTPEYSIEDIAIHSPSSYTDQDREGTNTNTPLLDNQELDGQEGGEEEEAEAFPGSSSPGEKEEEEQEQKQDGIGKGIGIPPTTHDSSSSSSSSGHGIGNPIPAEGGSASLEIPPSQHRTVFSTTTADKKYFRLDFLHSSALNPNIIPHATEADTWILTAQLLQPASASHSVWCAELTCSARFDVKAGTLRCIAPPLILPIAGTTSTQCAGEVSLLALSIGPHDARVFYGPDNPYAIWGSQSAHTCFGQWLVDFRVLVDWDSSKLWKVDGFRTATELQRPQPWGQLEKNWFVFWDADGAMYVHHDISPARVFSKLEIDGSVGEDLSLLVKDRDERCMKTYMPRIPPDVQGGAKHSIHQATNSLAITLCRRADAGCKQTRDNTLIFTIIHVKTWESFHSTYEPYVVLFGQTAPFALHSIGQKPIWINGRSTEKREMLYVTSMSWMKHGMKYHGFLDDVLFLAFGIEDKGTGGIDIVAGELLRDLGVCSDLG